MKTTFKKIMAMTIITSSLFISGCQKDLYDPEYVASKNGLITGVPSDFNWSTISSVNLTVNVDDQYNGEYYYVVEVFDSNPVIDTTAKLLTKGVAKKDMAFTTSVSIPQGLSTIYVRQTSPDGLKIVRTYELSSNSLTCDFRSAATKTVSAKTVSTTSKRATSISSITKPTPVDAEVIQNSANSTHLTSGHSYVIKSGTYSGDITYDGGTNTKLYIEGEWTISKDTGFNDGLEIIVQNGGKINFKSGGNISIKGSSSLWIMQGAIFNESLNTNVDLTLTNNGSINNQGIIHADDITMQAQGSQLNNSGTISLTGSLTISNNGEFSNDGKFGISKNKKITIQANGKLTNSKSGVISASEGSLTINSNGTVLNDGKFEIGSLTTEANSTITNNCYFNVYGDINSGGTTYNLNSNTYFGCDKLQPQNATFNMAAFSILEARTLANFKSNNKITGTGTGYDFALARFLKVTTESGPCISYMGNLEIECSDHKKNGEYDKYFETSSSVQSVAYGYPTVSIPEGDCTGTGSTPKTKNPASPIFPITVESGYDYTFAMEDSWPAYGDYDMNDLVTTIHTTYVKNSSNTVNQMIIDATLRAAGGTKPIGAALQLDNVSADNIKSVTYEGAKSSIDGSVFVLNGANVEIGQPKAVIPFFDNAHKFLNCNGITNTIVGTNNVSPQSVKVTITFNNPITTSSADIQALNFFIVTDGKKDQRTEIHLGGYNPTAKVNSTLFGTGVDNSTNGTKYTSKNDNLVWGIMIPTIFKYPVEYKNIKNVYPTFESWAASGGKNSTDWYNSPTSGLTY